MHRSCTHTQHTCECALIGAVVVVAVVDATVATVALNQWCVSAAVGNKRREIVVPIVSTQSANCRGHGARDPIVLEPKLA